MTVIGVLELTGEDGRARVRLDPSAALHLTVGDTVVVLGTEEDLDRLEAHIQQRLDVVKT